MPLDTLPADSDDRAVSGPFRCGNVSPCGGYPAPRWYVAQTHPQAERWATQNLQRRGYTTYLPLMSVKRRDRVLHSMVHTVQVPLFPRYVFVSFDTSAGWTAVWHTPGVSRLLTKDAGQPNPLPTGTVEAIRIALEAAEQAPAPDAAWKAGRPCSIAQGALRGCHGVVLSATRRTAVVAVVVLGGVRQVTVALAGIEARNP